MNNAPCGINSSLGLHIPYLVKSSPPFWRLYRYILILIFFYIYSYILKVIRKVQKVSFIVGNMGNSQVMPKVDFEKEELKTAHMYSKYMETKNFERYLLTKKLIRKKRIIFSSSVALVLGIYTYTILRIKQETFLDDFEEPEVIKK